MKLILSLSLLLFFITPLSAQVEEEEEIWSLEEDYISYFSEANHKAILSLYHSNFLGWPDPELHPAGKQRAAIFLEENYPAPIQVNFQLNREGIRMLGNIAITHYLVLFSWINEKGIEQKSETRITHTWIKEDSEWKILGGMSNRK